MQTYVVCYRNNTEIKQIYNFQFQVHNSFRSFEYNILPVFHIMNTYEYRCQEFEFNLRLTPN